MNYVVRIQDTTDEQKIVEFLHLATGVSLNPDLLRACHPC